MTAAIDFSDLTGVKPQQPKPQGFQTPPPQQQNNAQGFYSPDKTSGTNWQKHADEFFEKMKSFDGVRLPGERRHKNRLDKGPRNINEELVNKIKSLS